jgi:hypothetical protein
MESGKNEAVIVMEKAQPPRAWRSASPACPPPNRF